MAKIIEQLVVIKLSKLVKDSEQDQQLMDNETIGSLEEVVQSLVAESTIVEVVAD